MSYFGDIVEALPLWPLPKLTRKTQTSVPSQLCWSPFNTISEKVMFLTIWTIIKTDIA